jgi:hypothetical protein
VESACIRGKLATDFAIQDTSQPEPANVLEIETSARPPSPAQ